MTLRQKSEERVVNDNYANVAAIGCGYWGKNLVRNFANLGKLRWICDKNETALNNQAQLYPEVHKTGDFEAVLADEQTRAVAIATPAALHYTQVKQALLQGKDVFVEKPLALHYREGRELVGLAREKKAILMVGHILEYHPAVTLLKEIIQRGELGKVLYMYSNRLNLGKVRAEENILWSFAPHDIAVISSLIGQEPSVVSASGGTYLQSGIVDVTTTNLQYNDGTKAHIFVSWLHPFKEQKLVVVGDQKMAVFDDTIREGKLKIYDKGIEWQGGLPVARQTSETTLFIPEAEPLRLECQHFLDCIQERKQPLTDGISALKVLKVLEASQISLERGGIPVNLTEMEQGVLV
ncbi:Gfo/Idh/MocA family protein [Laspinema olomoucense]|uniref:Gfo/Idh/MocA family oxidoreductase n=1 Tax=Laspinema olomoucense D3b TaxID=2953688 RepID=A0ABT2N1H5_9CYAN|nr:Gfo/Idh/MocA family oxidoreductase [Laspinema sp. D3b]MCT7976497.1 Gfo/Idh/MocA family oxidoreductase [Laspinema sp. D3b]